eukprot:CAMPEP_0202690996 /NCGR_PEP_ID=MMETSP1385-20130828/5843_1 /ASSEMBLY_ACC=CAM_ASM_000861 /TAXON_ID=933848 /ORGANISM="Elphidium margaritaceum" /LENGTH=227 /DNA_ID=CAMNT_0049346337 /DNA_START=30 /DNA_END=713 /DNA_ORIENTATION=+
MAWLANGKTHADLIKQLETNKVIKNKAVAQAMLKVDRSDFAPVSPFEDSPQRIGFGATISAPHMHAYALEALFDHLQPGCTALDVGSGSGYLVAAMSYMVGDKGKVVGIEHIPELFNLGQSNLKKSHANLLKSGNVVLVNGDGRDGYKNEAPYDCIHVGAAAQPDVPPKLAAQLKNGGRMVIPVELAPMNQVFRMYEKDKDGKVSHKDIMGVMYVPLTDKQSQTGKK